MPVVRRFSALGALAALAVAGCGWTPRVVLQPAPVVDAVDPASIDVSLFLIGDAGHATPRDRVLAEAIRQGRRAPRSSAIVFLGDNVYPRGIPPDTAKSYPGARARLFTQARLSEATGLRAIFVAGNHDWDRQGAAGWVNVQRQGLLLKRFADSTGANVELLPAAGCPGPVTVELGQRARIVALDTQWWLQASARPGREPPGMRATMPDSATRCAIDTEAGVVDSLGKIHQVADGRFGIMVGHHPFQTSGEHGGYHPWVQYLFPLVPTPFAKWLWLPIGWIYPLGRKLLAHPQDLVGSANRAMVRALEGTFSAGSPLIYAAGHDHSLEVIRKGPGRFYLVSGAGTEDHQSAVGRSDSTAYASERPGFMRLDVMLDGRVRLGVTTLTRDGHIEESYQAWIKE